VKITPILLAFVFGFSMFAANAAKKPKYGSEITLLSESHGFIKASDAPDYWAISPYYLPQQDDRSCSVASVAMIINAARVGTSLTSDDEIATQKNVLKKTNSDLWRKAVGLTGYGVSLDQLAPLIENSLKAFGITKFKVETFHVDDTSKDTAAKLHEALVANEKSKADFIIINFIQGVFTGDADVGHIAPIAAYDSAQKKVLIMDPDRQWYEPYWVSEATLLKGMATKDKSSGKSRGYIWVKIL